MELKYTLYHISINLSNDFRKQITLKATYRK